MKKRLHNKKAGIAILVALFVISVAEIIFRAVSMKEFALTTENLGEQWAVAALSAIILILTAKGKDRMSIFRLCISSSIAFVPSVQTSSSPLCPNRPTEMTILPSSVSLFCASRYCSLNLVLPQRVMIL